MVLENVRWNVSHVSVELYTRTHLVFSLSFECFESEHAKLSKNLSPLYLFMITKCMHSCNVHVRPTGDACFLISVGGVRIDPSGNAERTLQGPLGETTVRFKNIVLSCWRHWMLK